MAGIRVNEPIDPTDRIALLNLFNEQLNVLSTKFQETSEKTILLIDGLDHIEREQKPERSLLCDLPLPQEVPNGVYIILGSQTDDLPDLRQRITDELQKDNHRVEMGKFSPFNTREIASAAILDLHEKENQKIFELTDGHPLALIYLLKEIQQISDAKARSQYLEECESFKGDIEDQYWSHWHRFEKDEELTFALGLLSRTRGPISMKWVSGWATIPLLRKIQQLFLTYFEKDSQDRWIFFHNSFRLFLIARTSDPLPGQTKEKLDQSLHLELASKYKDAKAPWSWETLYHYYSAGDHKAVVTLATWEWFINQVSALRPLDAVQTDIRLALESAGNCRDTISLARLTLVGASIQQRIDVLEDYPISDLLLRCGEPGLAADHLRDGNKLRVKTEEALNISANLFNAGLKREALKIFELSEPLELISGRLITNDATRQENLRDDLQAWARSVILFRSANDIVKTIRKIRVSPRWNNDGDIETESRKLHNSLIFQGALSCCEWNKWDSWRIFHDALENEEDSILQMFTLLRSTEYIQRHENPVRTQEFLSKLISTYPPSFLEEIDNSDLRIEAQISFAELLVNFEEHEQRAKSYIETLNPIPLYESAIGFDEKPIQQELRFRLSCLQYLLGKPQEPSQLLKDAEAITIFPQHLEEDQKQGYRHIALATYSLARLWAWGKSGSCLSAVAYMQEAKWIIDLFGLRWNELSRQSRFSLGNSQNDVLNCVILAAKQHGKSVLNALKVEYETRWLDSEEGEKWLLGTQRKLIASFSNAGVEPFWVYEQLKRISPLMFRGLDQYSRVEECKAQAETWMLIKNKEEVLHVLKQMVNAARGIRSEKDYQLPEWVKWVGWINEAEPNLRPEQIRSMLRRITCLQGVASGVADSADNLLEVIFKWSPNRAVKVWKAMIEIKLVSFKSSLIHLLNAALDSENPPTEEVKQIVLNLLIPFFSDSEPEILERLLTIKGRQASNSNAKETAQVLVDRICSDAISNNRFEWAEGVINGLEKIGLSKDSININPSVFEKKPNHVTSELDRNLFLNDGNELSPKEVSQAVNTVDDLKKILENEDRSKTKYFDWLIIVEHLAPKLTTESQINELESLICERLSNEISKDTYLVRLYIVTSQRYWELGNQKLSWEHAMKALNFSSPSGWVPHWDGGTRLKALQQLKKIDPDKTGEFIFDLYATDLSKQSYYPESLLPYLHEILGVLSKEINTSEIWAEIEYYLNDLFISEKVDEVTNLENALNNSNEMPEEDNPYQGIIEILFLCLTFPAYPIAQGAVTGLTELLKNDEYSIIDVINMKLMSSDDLLVERLLMVLDAISLDVTYAPILSSLIDNLEKLCYSPNFSIRLVACTVASRLKNSPRKIETKNTQLPAIYQLQVLEVSHHETWKEMQGEKSPFILGDLARKIRPFDEEFRIIAGIAKLPIDNILYRADNFFELFQAKLSWLENEKPLTDKKLSIFLDKTGVRVAHSKPHIFAARQALAYVIAELWDCGYLTSDNIRTFQLMLLNYDPSLIIRKPSSRPSFIPAIESQVEANSYERFSTTWVEKTIESISVIPSITDDNRIILAECTTLKFLQEDWPTESRYSVVKGIESDQFWDGKDINRGFSPIHNEINTPIQNYPEIQAPMSQLVISNNALSFESAGANWLALNPRLGFKLGWILKTDGLFEWLNQSGDIMVSSFWWRDGRIEQYPLYERVEVAEGWLVLASKSGFNELRQLMPILNRGYVATRRIGWLGDKASKTESEITPI